jgi:hypothetical protein
MTSADELALIAKAASDYPIPDYSAPPVKPDPMSELRAASAAQAAADRKEVERREAVVVRKWMAGTRSTGSSGAPAAANPETMCDLVVEIVTPIIADMAKQIAELEKRALLSEQRATALEQRAVRAEERLARTEERQLGPIGSSLSAHSGTTH